MEKDFYKNLFILINIFDIVAKIDYNATMYKYSKVSRPLTRKRKVLGFGDTCGFIWYGDFFTA